MQRFCDGFTMWYRRARTLRARPLVAQTMVISRLWHYTQHVSIPATVVKRWQSMLNRFVPCRKRRRISSLFRKSSCASDGATIVRGSRVWKHISSASDSHCFYNSCDLRVCWLCGTGRQRAAKSRSSSHRWPQRTRLSLHLSAPTWRHDQVGTDFSLVESDVDVVIQDPLEDRVARPSFGRACLVRSSTADLVPLGRRASL